jgi:hypothetical protein
MAPAPRPAEIFQYIEGFYNSRRLHSAWATSALGYISPGLDLLRKSGEKRTLPAVIATAEISVGERHRFMSNFLGTLHQKNRMS